MSPKWQRNIRRIFPFGLIWLVTGMLFLFVESVANRGVNPNPATDITVTPSVLIFAFIAITILGWIVGFFEMVILNNLFRRKTFLGKVFYKFLLYGSIMLTTMILAFPLAASIETGLPMTDPTVLARLRNFLTSLTFASTLVQLAFSLLLSFIYSGLSEHVGHRHLFNLLSGRYHNPQEEERIFMFLDLKGSTTVAEELGHIPYFKFLREYYGDLSDSIIKYRGEVYQYIGDEIVITWPMNQGIKDSNCIRCFYSMKEALAKREDYYRKEFGVSPSFKAGLHGGSVTTGEIGALKKEIFYTGDVLNVAARIQGLCNQFGKDLLLSAWLSDLLDWKDLDIQPISVGEVELKGKKEAMRILSIE